MMLLLQELASPSSHNTISLVCRCFAPRLFLSFFFMLNVFFSVSRTQAIESHTGVKMQEMKLKDDDVLSLLKDVAAAKRKVMMPSVMLKSANVAFFLRRGSFSSRRHLSSAEKISRRARKTFEGEKKSRLDINALPILCVCV